MKVIKSHTVVMETTKIIDAGSFHDRFSETFGFMEGYGRNWDAWIDIMGLMTDTHPGLSDYRIKDGHTLTLQIAEAVSFQERCPIQYRNIYDCTNAVNESYLR